ncbi:hypothetical protein CLU79DRAFT_838102 [Phycomyces nitens]|nr:hypothetical protein CLU79DRAFT_838102 [Phycomyces nitens]
MFSQTASSTKSASSIPTKRPRSHSQESIDISLLDSNDSSMDYEYQNCSQSEDNDDDDVIILLDPSDLDIESQFIFEICNISTVDTLS